MYHSWFVSKEERLGMKKFLFTIICVFMISFFTRFDDMSVVHATNLREEAVKLATDQVGYLEKDSMDNLYDYTANAGTNNYTKYAVELCVAYGQPWNATFFWWVMSTTGVPREAYPNRTTVTSDWYKERGMFRETTDYTPQPGDYIILGDRMQCGLVESVDVETNTVTYIAGNVSDSVARVTRNLDDEYIYGYGLIDYDYVYQPQGLDIGENHCAMIFKTSSGKYFRNYEQAPVLWLEGNRADYKWMFKRQEDGTYMIQSLYDGKVLQVKDAGTSRYTRIVLGDEQENDNHQKWYIINFGVGYRLIPKNATNYCMEAVTDNDGTEMWLWNHHDGMQQMFTLTTIDYIGLTGITIDSDYDKTMYVGESQILDYELAPKDASSDMVSWVSSDKSIAEVDEDGILKAKKEGMVTILCKSTFDNTISDKVVIQVKEKSTEQETTTEEQNTTTTEKQETSTEKQETSTEKQETSTEKQEESTEYQETTTEKTESAQKEVVNNGTKIKGNQCWFTITSVKKKTVKVIGVSNKNATNIKIPATVKYKGKTYKITAIEKNAFKNNKKIKTVSIGNNVKTIHESAFRGCKQLKNVVIGKKVAVIGKTAFYNCRKLQVIKIKSIKLKKIGSKAFKKIDKNPIIYAPKKKMKKYQKLFEGKI